MLSFVLLAALLLQYVTPGLSHNRPVVDRGTYKPQEITEYHSGLVIGNILNVHIFPAVNAYTSRLYSSALADLTFVKQRPHALHANPLQAEFMSTALYLRGMIY